MHMLLLCRYLTHSTSVHTALHNDFDTPTALQHLQTIIQDTNTYIATCKQATSTDTATAPATELIYTIASYVQRMLTIWGLTAFRPVREYDGYACCCDVMCLVHVKACDAMRTSVCPPDCEHAGRLFHRRIPLLLLLLPLFRRRQRVDPVAGVISCTDTTHGDEQREGQDVKTGRGGEGRGGAHKQQAARPHNDSTRHHAQ